VKLSFVAARLASSRTAGNLITKRQLPSLRFSGLA
jgi:hypothetical protein